MLSFFISFQHKSNKELKAFLFNDFLLLCKVQTPSKLPLGIFHPDCDIKLSIYKKVCTNKSFQQIFLFQWVRKLITFKIFGL